MYGLDLPLTAIGTEYTCGRSTPSSCSAIGNCESEQREEGSAAASAMVRNNLMLEMRVVYAILSAGARYT